MSQSYVSLWPNTSNKEWVNILPPCTSTTGVPSLHLIACFHKVYRNLLLQSLCAFWGTPLQLTSRFRVSREWDTNQAHGCTTLLRESHFLIQGKAPDMARGEPHTQGECWHTEPRTVSLVSPEQAVPCSPGSALYMAKLLTYQHLFSFYTKQVRALQGSTTSLLTFQSLREKLSFGFVSATFGCVRK